MKDLQVKIIIVGEIPCCVCKELMSQTDVDNQDALLSTNKNKLPFCNVIAHVSHFYVKENNFQKTTDYDLAMAKFAFAAGKDSKMLTPKAENIALAHIARLEAKYAD